MSIKMHLECLDQIEQEQLGARLENEDYFYLLVNYPDTVDLIKKSLSKEDAKFLDESITFLSEIKRRAFEQASSLRGLRKQTLDLQ